MKKMMPVNNAAANYSLEMAFSLNERIDLK
jgi:hypothetical protein